MNRRDGFTLIELLVVISVFTILLYGVSRLLIHTTEQSARITAQQESLESARIAVDALTVNLQMADEITLHTYADGALRRIYLFQIDSAGLRHRFVFTNNRTANRLLFSGNELASNINDVRLSVDGGLMHIAVTAGEALGESITLTGTVDIRYKD